MGFSAVRRSPAVLSAALLTLLLFGICAVAQDGTTHFSGEVSRGQEYRREIRPDLIFVLSPDDSGWMISVVPKASCADNGDWASVVNAPIRNYNSLFVNASYGVSAQEAVKQWNPREFSFVLTCADYIRERHRLDIILWPYNYSKKEADEALAKWGSSYLGKAKFIILDSRISRAEQDIDGKNYGKIDWLKFRLDVTIPAGGSKKVEYTPHADHL